MKLVFVTSAFWLAVVILVVQVMALAPGGSVLAAGPAPETTPPAITPSPSPTPGAPSSTVDKMRQHIDATMGPGSFDLMRQAMGPDAEQMMAACASAMGTGGGNMTQGSMSGMMNGSMGNMMNGMMSGGGGSSMGNGMMGR